MDGMAEAGSVTMLSYAGHENCSDCAYAALKQKSMSSARLRENHLFINYRSDISTDNIIKYKGTLYNITRVDVYEGYKNDLTLYCKKQ